MKKLFATVLAVIFFIACLTSCSSKSNIIFVTGDESGMYYEYGSIISEVLNDSTNKFSITTQTSSGSKDNLLAINKGTASIAFVQNDVMSYAYSGTNLFTSKGAVTSFSVIAAMYPETCQIVSASNITSIEELYGKSISVGDSGSGVEFNAKQILAAYGITFDDIRVQNLSFTKSAEALKSGFIDAFFCTAGDPTSAVAELAENSKINLLEIDDERAALLQKDYPFYEIRTIKGGTYNGISEDVQTVAIKATIVASNKLSEDVVYQITKNLFENRSKVNHDKSRFIDPGYATTDLGRIPLHPGAAKYYTEIGITY